MFFKLLQLGSEAPDFTLADEKGQFHQLSHCREKHAVILVFYPADFTLGCTRQLCGFKEVFNEHQQSTVLIWGVNGGSAHQHQLFSQKYQLGFPLLCDVGMQVAKQYKAILIPRLLQNRVVYGINRQGFICFAQVGNPSPKTVFAALQT